MRLRVMFGPLLAVFGGVAQAEENGFDHYVLLSPTHRAASQDYAVRGRECEAAVYNVRGNQTFDKIDLTAEIKAQGGAVACRQALNEGGLVLGMLYSAEQFTLDGVIFRSESFSSTSQPSLTFALGPWLSLGFRLSFVNEELKTEDERYAVTTQNTEVSLSAHQDKWEFTIVSGERWRNSNEEHPAEDIPRHLLIQALARPFPFFGLGIFMDRVDHKGTAVDETTVQNEVSTGFLVTSQFLQNVTAEVSLEMASASGGDPETKTRTVHGMLGYRFNQTIKMAASLMQYTADYESANASATQYAMSLTAEFP